MLTNCFDKLGVTTSLLGFGCMRFPKEKGKDTADRAATQAMIDRAVEAGVTYFDTAYVYGGGDSERTTAAALQKYPRQSYYLANKLPVWMLKKPEDMERIFQESLDRCQTDYFDFYLAHSLDREAIEIMEKLYVVDFLEQKRAEGKIKYVGFSFHDTSPYLRRLLEMHRWDFCQLQLNYADWVMDEAQTLYQLSVEYHVPCIVMEPVRGGFLANPPAEVAEIFVKADPTRSPASWALRFAASLPNVRVVLSGMSSMEQVEDNLATFSDPSLYLSDKDRLVIEAAGDALRKTKSIPCTGCRYCDGCPVEVDIPTVFQWYNNMVLFNKPAISQMQYESQVLSEGHGADRCISCGACSAVCPQGLDVPARLAEAHKALTEK
ncbi:MAG: aldo/keto reductase [Angelakisella sp.]|nr:aldo/keto reductase [Angelakisella sp.]